MHVRCATQQGSHAVDEDAAPGDELDDRGGEDGQHDRRASVCEGDGQCPGHDRDDCVTAQRQCLGDFRLVCEVQLCRQTCAALLANSVAGRGDRLEHFLIVVKGSLAVDAGAACAEADLGVHDAGHTIERALDRARAALAVHARDREAQGLGFWRRVSQLAHVRMLGDVGDLLESFR